MPQSKKRKKGSSSGLGSASGRVYTIAERAAEAHLATLMPGFGAWLRAENYGEQDYSTESLLFFLLPTIRAHAALTRHGSATQFRPHEFMAAVRETTESYGGPDDGGARYALARLMHIYVTYLEEMGLWDGEESALDHLWEHFDAYLDELAVTEGIEEHKPLSQVVPESVSSLEDVQSLSDSVLPSAARALLAWVGEKHAVTSTAAIRRQDLRETAAMLGLDVLGVQKWAPSDGGEPRQVTSMVEVTELSCLWDAMVSTGVLSVAGSNVIPGLSAPALRVGSAGITKVGDELTIAEKIVMGYLFSAMGYSQRTSKNISFTLHAQALERDLVWLATFPNGLVPEAAFEVDEVEDGEAACGAFYTELMGKLARSQMDRMVELGLVDKIQSNYRFAPGVMPLVLEIFDVLGGNEPGQN